MPRNGDIYQRSWKTSSVVGNDSDIDTLTVEFDGGSDVKGIPFESENAMVTRRNERGNVERVSASAQSFTVEDLRDFEIFLLRVGKIGIVGKIEETISHMKSREFPSSRDGLSRSQSELRSARWETAANEFRAACINTDWSFLQIVGSGSALVSSGGNSETTVSPNAN